MVENWLNIKKVMGRNVWMCFVSTVLTYIAFNALEILKSCINNINICSIEHIVLFNALYQQYQQYLMIWLKSPESQLSKFFSDLKLVEY